MTRLESTTVVESATVAVAHRGDSSRFRENTVPAIRSAIDRCAAAVEIDVRVTADGEVVVLHDPTLERLWGVGHAVADLTWRQVSGIGSPDTRIPRLADVLPLFDGLDTMLLIDMDSTLPALPAHAVVGAFIAAGGRVRVAWCGLLSAMQEIRAADSDSDIWMPWADAELPDSTTVEMLRPSTLNLPHLVIGRSLVRQAHDAGMRVSAWTVDDPGQMAWLRSIGVDSITSNRLDVLVDVVGAGVGGCGDGDGSPAPEPVCDALDLDRAALVAHDLAVWANEYTRSHGIGTVALKANPADHVTEVDTAIEKSVRMVVAAQFPEHRFVGEEFGGTADGDTPCWYLDPVDGTANLANGVPWTSFSLALVVDRLPVVAVVGDPWRDHVLEARAGHGATLDGKPLTVEPLTGSGDPLRGAIVGTELDGHRPWPGMLGLLDGLADRFCTTRIMGSGTMTLAGVALGHGVGAVIGAFGPVDHLAATLIVHEAGGVVLDRSGTPNLFPTSGGVLAARDETTARALHELWTAAVAEDARR